MDVNTFANTTSQRGRDLYVDAASLGTAKIVRLLLLIDRLVDMLTEKQKATYNEIRELEHAVCVYRNWVYVYWQSSSSVTNLPET